MGDRARLQRIPVKLDRTGHYFIGRMLMLRERLGREQWAGFERAADAMCDGVLGRLPADHPESAAWDNRRKPGR